MYMAISVLRLILTPGQFGSHSDPDYRKIWIPDRFVNPEAKLLTLNRILCILAYIIVFLQNLRREL